MSDLTLAFSRDEAENYAELATASHMTLDEVQNGFRGVLKENTAHSFRQTLTPMLEELLGYLEELPEIDCEALPKDAHEVVKGWLIHHGVLLELISGYYAGMSEEA